jgi:hypothetical protein
MFKKFISMTTAVLLMASGISFVGTSIAVAANAMTLTTASKIKGVRVVNLGTPNGNQGYVELSASRAADTSGSGDFVTEFIPTDSGATVAVKLYPDATNGMGNPDNFQNYPLYNVTAPLSNNQLFVIKVTRADGNAHQYYEIAVLIVSSDATLSFGNSRLKSVTLGNATAYDDIAQLATSSNRASITLTSAQASSTSGDQTIFGGAGINSTTTAKRFASSVSSLNSSVFDSANSVTSSTVFTNGDYVVIKVVAEDLTTTKYYGYSVTVTSSGGSSADANLSTFILRNSSGLQQITISPSFSSNTTSYTATTTATTVEIQRDVSAQGSASTVNLCNGVQGSASSACALNLGSNTFAVRVTNGQTQKTYTITITRTASGGSSPAPSTPAPSTPAPSTPAPSTPTLTPAQIAEAAAAAAKAAAEAAAVARAAEIATAQTALATVLRGDKAGSLSEYRAANINVTTAASLTRLNAEVLKLSAADRADFAKIKAIADKIEFDESFFNATARPSLATYSSYGVTGVTERILPVINAKVLELPAALRADVKAMQELVKVESFVDRVANPATRSTVSAVALIERGLFPANSIYKFSVVRGLGSYPEGSLNTVAKIEAAVKEQIFKAEAPKRRLAEIKARMAARKK